MSYEDLRATITIQIGLNIGNPKLIDKLCGYADDIVFIINDRTVII